MLIQFFYSTKKQQTYDDSVTLGEVYSIHLWKIGSVQLEQGRREMNLTSFFLEFYVSIYYLKNQIAYDKL